MSVETTAAFRLVVLAEEAAAAAAVPRVADDLPGGRVSAAAMAEYQQASQRRATLVREAIGHAQAVATDLSEAQALSLRATAAGGSGPSAAAARRVLGVWLKQHPPHGDWFPFLADEVRSAYPAAAWAVDVLRSSTPDVLASALRSVDPSTLTDGQFRTFVRDVRTLSRPEALELLGRLAAGGDRQGFAQQALEALGGASPQRIRQVAETWRERHDRASLSWLYEAVIVPRLPEAESIATLLPLLGPPSEQHGCSYWFNTAEEHPMSLYLEASTDGRLDGWKLK